MLAPFNWDPESETLRYTDRLATGRVTTYTMQASTNGIRAYADLQFTPSERAEVRRKLAWMFALDSDLSAFYKAARGVPQLANARRLAHGRILRSPTLFEDVVKTIFTTNTTWSGTKRMTLKLVEGAGTKIKDGTAQAFPTPKQIAKGGMKLLDGHVRAGYRAPAVLELAEQVASGVLDLNDLADPRRPTLELRKKLMSLRGVGPYAAANLLMLLGRSDFIPVDSLALQSVSQEWHRGRPVTEVHVQRAFRKWGEYKGLAFWFWQWKSDGG